MSFMKQDKEERLMQRKQDMEERAQQREEDMKLIKDMINKVVASKVLAALSPVEKKLELQEKVNQDLYKKLSSLTKELEVLKLDSNVQHQALPVLPEPPTQQVHHEIGRVGHPRNQAEQQIDNSKGVYSEKRKLCALSRKIVGFTPINSRMLEMQMESYGAKDIEEAKLMEVKSYLKCEMKVLPSVVEKLNFVRIFPPAKEDWNVLYVEFESEREVDLIFNHTSSMTRPDHRVIRWIPRQMFVRFKAIQALPYKIRKEEGLKTRVKIDHVDFQLSVRAQTSSRWCYRKLPDELPEFDLDQNSSIFFAEGFGAK